MGLTDLTSQGVTEIDGLSDVTGVDEVTRDTTANKPGSPSKGHLFISEDDGFIQWYNGTSWVDVGLSEDQIALGNLSSHAHSDLTGIGAGDHHVAHEHPGDLAATADITDDQGNILWDYGNQWIPRNVLEFEGVTVAGNSVLLGNSTPVDHADLSNIGSGDHHSKTSQASELSDVSADSVADAHHAQGQLTYVQGSEPSGSSGETWLDTNTGVLYTYHDPGTGADWYPSTVVTVLNEAADFLETDITLSGTFAIRNGSLDTDGSYRAAELAQVRDVGTTEDTPTSFCFGDSGTKGYEGDAGDDTATQFSMSTAYDVTSRSDTYTGVSLPGLQALNWNDAGSRLIWWDDNSNLLERTDTVPTNWDLQDAANETISDSLDPTAQLNDVQAFSFGPNFDNLFLVGLNDNNIYWYELSTSQDLGTASFTKSVDISQYTNDSHSPGEIDIWDSGSVIVLFDDSLSRAYTFYPDTPYDLDTVQVWYDVSIPNSPRVDGGAFREDNGEEFTVLDGGGQSLIQFSTEITLGTVRVEWTSSINDIDAWDFARYVETLNGGTVTVDVEDSQGNVLVSDIDSREDISGVATSEDVRFAITFGGNQGTDFPTLDYIARRYIR